MVWDLWQIAYGKSVSVRGMCFQGLSGEQEAPSGGLIEYFAWQSFSKKISSGDNKSRERCDILTNILW